MTASRSRSSTAPPTTTRRLGELLDRIGLERTAVSAMGDPAMNLISPDAAARKAGVDYVKRGDRLLRGARRKDPVAARCTRRSAISPASGPTAAEKKRSISSQRAIGDHAGKKGVTIGLEALNRFECYLVNTMADLSAHIDAIDHPDIKAMYDTFHCQYRGSRSDQGLHQRTSATSSTSIFPRTTAACPGAATSRGPRPSRRSARAAMTTG